MIIRAIFVSVMMMAVAAATGVVEAPAPAVSSAPDIEAMLPDSVGEWRRVALNAAVLPAEAELGPGEAVAYRAYKNRVGRKITLVVAYGPPLGDSVRLHRPESCYVAQGFAIRARSIDEVRFASMRAPIIRLSTEKVLRREAVSYWLRDGESYVTSAPGHQLLFFKRGLSAPADGALVRISSTGGADEFLLHDDFIAAFTSALSPEAKALLTVARL